ncbi:tRNA preQ1(34) S-adenosylmethionine ribosyltransferase-isomerase QueA [Leptolyngbya sp. Cla-17]|uniref:tRNA preQ1(34) S-adenosylmethionine ribosyltransferase-isomerase QueA n=1 Tax=Leptolyngbya sp. Cla-17 TaxID=2803751 RepID=UPI001492C494|nr:tRNA preQ1(34) S-adenosylmethionine ribosyltransferase-isomerase QueA [Leptolyngbya sp. Cla-17]
MNRDRVLAAYDYILPTERIAQTPTVPRDTARLLVVKENLQQAHGIFRDLPNWLRSGDLLVLNNTRVLPARLHGCKSSGMPVEVLLLEPQPEDGAPNHDFSHRWLALVKPGRRLKPGTQIWFGQPPDKSDSSLDSSTVSANVLATDSATSGRILQFNLPSGQSLQDWLETYGQMPLPPYITNPDSDPAQYQTVYADRLGAVAAPTAGLHFTPELLQTLQGKGIQQAFVTLHVGVGTFRPVEAEDITVHQMHSEWAEVPLETVELIRKTKAAGGRVIAVGTTAVRALEGAAQTGAIQPFQGKVDLFIYPGYEWRVVDGLITNFHLPKSSLLMLVSGLIGRSRLLDLYEQAIAADYRFYSFGDAMLILPEAKIGFPTAS